MKIGSARYGGQKKNYFKLKDGESSFRILPPLGDLADQGVWSVYYNVHYGYKNSKGKMRPFQSPLVKNRTTKMIEVSDPALDRINALKAALDKAKAEKNGELVEKLSKLVGSKNAQFNLDSHHYMNVIDTQGNIGILKIRHRAKLALDAEIKRLRGLGVDPLSVENGRFFKFTRSGMGLETIFQVTVLSKTIDVQGVGQVQQEIVHQLDESTIKRLAMEAAELNKIFKKPTSEEVARIVKDGAIAVDAILDTAETVTADDSSGGPGDEEEAPAATTTTAAAPAVTQTAAPAPTAPAVQAQAPAPTPAPTPTTQTVTAAPTPSVAQPQQSAPATQTLSSPGKTTAAAVSEMSDDDFLKSLGV